MRYPFAFTRAYRIAARPFGITPARAWVEVTETELRARFGPWRIRTPLSNIRAVTITGPYAFLKTAGPAHLGWTDLGLTFASNGHRGVELQFHERIAGIEPTGRLRHVNLTLTVADCDGLAQQLRDRMAP